MNWGRGRLPNLVVIGAMKAGTTSMHGLLDAHPDIFMSREKELNYFVEEENLHRGEGWYRRRFRTDRPFRGEATPRYAAWPRHPGVPERMRAVIPDARLIYCVRDPISRALSHVRHAQATGMVTKPADAVVLREPFLRQSRYASQLERYLGAGWPPDRIHIVQAEALRARRTETMRAVLAFLGANEAGYDPERFRDRHASGLKRRPTARGQRLRRALAPALDQLPWSVRTHVERVALRPFTEPLPPPTLTPDTRARLEAVLAPEAERLRALTGLPLDGWSV